MYKQKLDLRRNIQDNTIQSKVHPETSKIIKIDQ
jgi:hypothetical protein